MIPAHLGEYEPREWVNLGEMDTRGERYLSLLRATDEAEDIHLVDMTDEDSISDSSDDNDENFFFHEEQPAAGIVDIHECELHRLVCDWEDHEEGQLVMVVFTCPPDSAPIFTVCIEA